MVIRALNSDDGQRYTPQRSQDSQKKLESLIQTKTLKKEATEGWLNDYMKGLAANMEEKFDNVSKTLAML